MKAPAAIITSSEYPGIAHGSHSTKESIGEAYWTPLQNFISFSLSLNFIAWIMSLLLSLYLGRTSNPASSIILAQNIAPFNASIATWGAKNNPW